MGFLLGVGGGGLPRSCRAGDDSFGHDHPLRTRITITILESFVLINGSDVVVVIQGCGGGGSVRRRNALHEVGGRVPEVPRVRMREQV